MVRGLATVASSPPPSPFEERADTHCVCMCANISLFSYLHIISNKFCPTFDSTDTVSCSSGAFRCNNGQCIRSVNRCDGTRNCTDGSDETGCSKFHLIAEILRIKILVKC